MGVGEIRVIHYFLSIMSLHSLDSLIDGYVLVENQGSSEN
jgi:hypothetical protein